MQKPIYSKVGKPNFLFQFSETFGTNIEAMHGILTDIKKSSKTKFLPNIFSLGGQGGY